MHCNLWKLCTTLHSGDRNQLNILDNILFITFIRRFIHVLHVVKIHVPLLFSLCMQLLQSLHFNETLSGIFPYQKEIQSKYLVGTNPCCFFYQILLSTSTRANFNFWINILICGAASSRYENCLCISYSPVKCIAGFLV